MTESRGGSPSLLRPLAADVIISHLDAELPHWRYDGAALVRAVECPTFAGGIRLINAVALVSDELDHHPDIDVRWTTVTFRLWTHVAHGVTARDFRLAVEIDRLAGAGVR